MTSAVSRLGTLESKLATSVVFSSGKRKRTGWVCARCRNRRNSIQRRAYSDDTLPFPSFFSLPIERSEDQAPVRTVSYDPHRMPWGLGRKDRKARPSERQGMFEELEAAFTDVGHAPWITSQSDEMEEVEDALGLEDAESLEDAQSAPAKLDIDARPSFTYIYLDPSLLDVGYQMELGRALESNAPDMVARCLFAAAQKDDVDFIRSIPSSTFSECIYALRTSNFTRPLAIAHLEISEAMSKQLGLLPIHEVAWQHMQLLQEILGMRRNVSAKLTLADYRVLLRSASELGDRGLVESFWRKLHEDGFKPDTACYNAVMAASVQNGMHSAVTRHRVRVVPFHMLARSQPNLGSAFANYRIEQSGKGLGLKAQVVKTFGNMLRDGAIADEESFRQVMLAAAREGDIATVKSVLRKVWDIDVDALVIGQNETYVSHKQFAKDSTLQPSQNLLFVIAHAFGINNDVPTALRLVDFVARCYELEIDLRTWSQLFEWTFVLATPRTRSTDHENRSGQLPLQSVLNIWQTMVGPPYLVKPTMGMYNHLIKNLQERDWAPAIVEKMTEGQALYHESVKGKGAAWKALSRAVRSGGQVHDSRPLEALRRDFELTSLIERRNNLWVKRWLRILLSTLRTWIRRTTDDTTVQNIPQLLWQWRFYAPTRVRYENMGGIVEFDIRTPDEVMKANRSRELVRAEEAEVLQKVPLLIGAEWTRRRQVGGDYAGDDRGTLD